MSAPPRQPFDAYLGQVLAQLRRLPPERRAAVLDELRAHLHDAAVDSGRHPADAEVQAEVIGALGSPRRLGRALARVYRDEQGSRSAAWLWWGWVGAAVVGWPLGALVGLVTPSPDLDTALLAIHLGGAVAALLQLLVLRHAIPSAVRDVLTPALFYGGWLLGALVFAPFPIHLFWETVMEPLLLAVPLSVGLLAGAFQQAALRRAVGPIHLWSGASSVGLLAGFILALITGNIAWGVELGGLASAIVALCTLGGTQAAVTGAVLIQATAGARAVHGLAGGSALVERAPPRPRSPLLGQLATAFAALPVLLICGGLLLGQPAIRPETTAEITARSVRVFSLEGGRVGLALPDTAATLYVHEDHLQVFRRDALIGVSPEQPLLIIRFRAC